MSMIRRTSLALLAVVLLAVGASTASAGLVVVGQLSGDDSVALGALKVTVTNFADGLSNDELPAGDNSFHDLVLDLLDAGGQSLATYPIGPFGPISSAAPWETLHLNDASTPFPEVARVVLKLMFRGMLLTSTIQTCASDDGCFEDVFGVPPFGDPCLDPLDTCEVVGRMAGAVIEYDVPATSVPDGGVPMGEAVASLLAMTTALRYRRRRRADVSAAAPLA